MPLWADPHINTSLPNIFLTALLLTLFHQNCQAAFSVCALSVNGTHADIITAMPLWADPHINTSLSNIFLTALLLTLFHQNCQAAFSICALSVNGTHADIITAMPLWADPHINTSLPNIFLTALLLTTFHQNCQAAFSVCALSVNGTHADIITAMPLWADPHINTSLPNIFLTALLLTTFHQNCQAAFSVCALSVNGRQTS